MKRNQIDFVHLHNHSRHSLCRGLMKSHYLVQSAVDCRMRAVAITDHNLVSAASDFSRWAQVHSIKPIVGAEVTVVDGGDDGLGKKGSPSGFHLTLLAMDSRTGYHNLCLITSRAHLMGRPGSPSVDKEYVRRHAAGLIALSGCLKGEIPQALGHGSWAAAERISEEFREIYPGNFYLELQDNGIRLQSRINKGLVSIGRRLGIPVVATGNCRYKEASQSRAYAVMKALRAGVGADIHRWSVPMSNLPEYHFRSPEEMMRLFSGIPEAMRNTVEIAAKCDNKVEFEGIVSPRFQVPAGETSSWYLRDVAQRKFAELFGSVSPAKRLVYEERFEAELAIIESERFCDYFLIAWDLVRYAKSRGITVGPGRGSIVGSLVAHCLGMTEVDPVPNGLIFERFLHPDYRKRANMCLDFDVAGRKEVFQYARQVYGERNVLPTISFRTIEGPGLILSVAEVLKTPLEQARIIAGMLPECDNRTSPIAALSEEPACKALVANDRRVAELMATACSLEGACRMEITQEPDDVVIFSEPNGDAVPVCRGDCGETVLQYSSWDIMDMNQHYYFIGGLPILSMLRRSEEQIRKLQLPGAVPFDLTKIPLDDLATYLLLGSGNLDGVFGYDRCHEDGLGELAVRLCPESIEDLAALYSLARPGPRENGIVDAYLERRRNPQVMDFPKAQYTRDLNDFVREVVLFMAGKDETSRKPGIKPEVPAVGSVGKLLWSVLEDTYGVPIYQEQIVRVLHEIAGLSIQDAELLRRNLLNPQDYRERLMPFTKYLEGMEACGLGEADAKEVWSWLRGFAPFAFMKSHAVAFSLIMYRAAYVKAHYPWAFPAAGGDG